MDIVLQLFPNTTVQPHVINNYYDDADCRHSDYHEVQEILLYENVTEHYW